MRADDGDDFLIPGKSRSVDLEAAQMWRFLGADMKQV